MEEELCSVCNKCIKIYIKKYNICSFCYSRQWREKHPRKSTKNPNKISHWVGRKHSEETKLKISLAKKGTKAWNKGTKADEATKKKLSDSHKGYKHTESQKEKIRLSLKGRPGIKGRKMSVEERIRRSNSAPKGNKNHMWKGGITEKNHVIRTSLEYRIWRELIFNRDNFTCVLCNKHGGNLNADHIKPFSMFPELRFELSNGRTLCVPCHRQTDTYGSKIRFKKYENI